MTQVTLKPELSPDDRVEFVDDHRPTLRAGDYTLSVSLTARDVKAKRTTRMNVAGERYSIKSEDLHACFPPNGSRGAFHTVLPHLVFDRSTLPWERSPWGGRKEMGSPPTWLTLFLFVGAEIPKIKVVRAADLARSDADGKRLGGLWSAHVAESSQDPDERVSVVHAPWKLLKVLAPKFADLKWQAHARCVRYAKPEHPDLEVAVLMGNRLPPEPPGENDPPVPCAVHLVSLENCYRGSGRQFQPFTDRTPNDDELVQLISLYHWEFSSERQPDFLATMENLDGVRTGTDSALRHAPAGVADARAAAYLDAGSTPLPHHFREGDRSLSWYRGPLVPALPADGWLAQLPLPASYRDELLIFDSELGQFDAGYAVAWELGRLMALSDRHFSIGLARWKRARARNASRLRLELDAALLPHPHATSDIADFPAELQSFLDALVRLEGVPCSHLVPDERMLPVESLRFFDVDPLWLECLRDGAMSIGRVTAGEAARDADHLDHQPAPPRISGCLIRSAVVSHFPRLTVNGYCLDGEAIKPEAIDYKTVAHLNPAHGYKPLPILHQRRLAPELLLVLFHDETDGQRELDLIEFHLPPEVLHFGFDFEAGGWTKKLRSPATGKEEPEPVKFDDSYFRDPLNGARFVRLDQVAKLVLKAAKPMLQRDLATVSGEERSLMERDLKQLDDSPPLGLFGLQMLAAAPCFRVWRQEAKS